MSWMNAVNEIISRYSGQAGGAAASGDPHQDFQQVARAAPPDVVAGGISQMFRSDQTPSFAEMVANLFGRSNPTQRAGLLNRLVESIGGAGGLSAVPGLGGELSGLLGDGAVTPQQANAVAPEQVQQIAAHAERRDPSVIDKVSSFYSQHPDVVQAVGGLAISVALQHMLRGR